MEHFITPELVTSLAAQVPALLIVAGLLWVVFKGLIRSLDRMPDSLDKMSGSLEGMRGDLQKNTAAMTRNTASTDRAAEPKPPVVIKGEITPAGTITLETVMEGEQPEHLKE